MILTDYTTYAEIRSTCGLSSDELPDSVLANELYINVLDLALADVELPTEEPGPGPLADRFLVIKAIAEASRTTAQQKLYNLTRLFSTYAVALEVVVSLSMRAPKSVSDSKASLVRFSPESTYELVIDAIRKKLDDLKGMIEGINATTVTTLPYLNVVNPATDPVTGA